MSSVFYLTTCHMAGSHVGKMHVILDMEGHVSIQVVICQITYKIPIQYKLK